MIVCNCHLAGKNRPVWLPGSCAGVLSGRAGTVTLSGARAGLDDSQMQLPLSPSPVPPEVNRFAVWLDYRFALSLRDVEDWLAPPGIIVSYESIRRRCPRFRPRHRQSLQRRAGQLGQGMRCSLSRHARRLRAGALRESGGRCVSCNSGQGSERSAASS